MINFIKDDDEEKLQRTNKMLCAVFNKVTYLQHELELTNRKLEIINQKVDAQNDILMSLNRLYKLNFEDLENFLSSELKSIYSYINENFENVNLKELENGE